MRPLVRDFIRTRNATLVIQRAYQEVMKVYHDASNVIQNAYRGHLCKRIQAADRDKTKTDETDPKLSIEA
jgi:hypothetical protein